MCSLRVKPHTKGESSKAGTSVLVLSPGVACTRKWQQREADLDRGNRRPNLFGSAGSGRYNESRDCACVSCRFARSGHSFGHRRSSAAEHLERDLNFLSNFDMVRWPRG